MGTAGAGNEVTPDSGYLVLTINGGQPETVIVTNTNGQNVLNVLGKVRTYTIPREIKSETGKKIGNAPCLFSGTSKLRIKPKKNLIQKRKRIERVRDEVQLSIESVNDKTVRRSKVLTCAPYE